MEVEMKVETTAAELEVAENAASSTQVIVMDGPSVVETAEEATIMEVHVEVPDENQETAENQETIIQMEEAPEGEESIIQMEVPCDQQMATVQLGDLSGHSVQELAEHLPNIGIHFTCKKCNIHCNQMSEVLAHFTDGKCNNTPPAPPKKRGRPKKSEVKEQEPSTQKPLYTISKESEYEELPRISAPPPTSNKPASARRTRYSEGKIQRLDVLTLLGGKIKEEPLDEDDDGDEYKPPPQSVLHKRSLEDDELDMATYSTFVQPRPRGRPKKIKLDEIELHELENPERLELMGTEEDGYTSVTIEDAGNSKVIVVNRGKPENADGVRPNDEEGGEEQDPKGEFVHTDNEEDAPDKSQTKEDGQKDKEGMEDLGEDEEAPVSESEQSPSKKGQAYSKPIQQSVSSYSALMNRKRQNKCKICKQRFFYTQEELQVHTECHKNTRSEREEYACISADCTYTSGFWNRMLDHLITHDEYRKKLRNAPFLRNIVGNFSCPVCKKKFERKNNMKGHLSKVHFKQDKTCEICGLTMATVDEKTYKRHVEKCQNLLFQCSHCDYRTPVSANMRKHMKIHLGQGFSCEICNAVFPSKQRHDVHRQIHESAREQFMCDVCGQAFMSTDAVKKHIIRFHTETTVMYNCPDCQFKTKINSDLKKHISSVHNKKFRCNYCPFQTNSAGAFEQHEEYHKPGRNFPCTYANCFYRGATAKQLSNHVGQVHKQVSKHECPVCHKLYKKKTHLARHLVAHTGDKPYVCLECNAAFSSHSTYYRHRQKTGHDAKREGIVSVPQNITIQYVSQTELTPQMTDQRLQMNNMGEYQVIEPGGGEDAIEYVTQTVDDDATSSQQKQNIIILENENGEQVTYMLKIAEDGSGAATIVSEDGVQMDAGLAQQIQAQLAQLQDTEILTEADTTNNEAGNEGAVEIVSTTEETVEASIIQDAIPAEALTQQVIETLQTHATTTTDEVSLAQELVQEEPVDQVEFVTEEISAETQQISTAVNNESTEIVTQTTEVDLSQLGEMPQEGVLQIETTGENGEPQTLYIVQQPADGSDGEQATGEQLAGNNWVQLSGDAAAELMAGSAQQVIQTQDAAPEQETQQIMYEESVVEVDNPNAADGESQTQYAIVLVPSSGEMGQDEPEAAALSMLQLQSGNNVVVRDDQDTQIIMQQENHL